MRSAIFVLVQMAMEKKTMATNWSEVLSKAERRRQELVEELKTISVEDLDQRFRKAQEIIRRFPSPMIMMSDLELLEIYRNEYERRRSLASE